MRSRAWLTGVLLASTSFAFPLGVRPLGAQSSAGESLTARVGSVRTGTVLMTFAPRPGVCSDGHGAFTTTSRRSAQGDGNQPWSCVPEPVRVAIARLDGEVVSVREWVGGRFSPASSDTDLGVVSAPDAARYLVGLARAATGRSADEALAAATFADSVDISPELTALVMDAATPVRSRTQALFWLGQSDAPTSNLVRLDPSLTLPALRDQFVFVLSQRDDPGAVDKLVDIARHDTDPKIRKRAMFWLGQSRDPRALKFFRDILTG